MMGCNGGLEKKQCPMAGCKGPPAIVNKWRETSGIGSDAYTWRTASALLSLWGFGILEVLETRQWLHRKALEGVSGAKRAETDPRGASSVNWRRLTKGAGQ